MLLPPALAPLVSDSPGRPKFPRDEIGFHTELKKRVAAYFAATGAPERGGWRIYLKAFFILSLFTGCYIALVFAPLMWWEAIPIAALFAFAVTAVGFSIQHDGGHGAFSNWPIVNRFAAMTMDMVGASSYLWRWKHGILHHTFTNVPGHDTDLESGGIARLSPHQPRYWYHRWQHFYLWPLYAVTAPRWHLMGDVKEVIAGKMCDHTIPRPRGWDLFVFIGGKVATIGMVLVLPMFFHPWWQVLAMYFAITGTVGLLMTVVFQLAHCVEEADFPAPIDDQQRMEAAWAVHQVETTVDFARTSRFLTWYLGGLNFQIVHHLFPRICHVHYRKLSKIVEATCLEYGVRYTAHPSFFAGIRSHYRWLRKLGRGEGESMSVTVPTVIRATAPDPYLVGEGVPTATAG